MSFGDSVPHNMFPRGGETKPRDIDRPGSVNFSLDPSVFAAALALDRVFRYRMWKVLV